MGFTATQFARMAPQTLFGPVAFFWCTILLLPLSAFFSAICLAVGAYARSSKEGQYYLMPLFLFTMPLIFLTLAPGVELNPFYSLVPVTGVALLLQKLLAANSPEQVPWLYFLPVLAPMVLYGWLALRWAVEQFRREEVLFREAERLDLGLWLRRLFRDKEAAASTGQAVFCFALIVVLHWIGFGLGGRLPLLVRTGIGLLAFVAAPTLFIALILTTRPRQALGVTWPGCRMFVLGGLLAILIMPPLSQLTLLVLRQFPGLTVLLAEHNPLTAELRQLALGLTARSSAGSWILGRGWQVALGLIVLPAVCEELAFRGFILGGLRRRFGPWMAIAISSFLFALYHFNVFQFVPTFLLGVVLGLLALRSGSVLPSMLFHLLHNGLLVAAVVLERPGFADDGLPGTGPLRSALVFVCLIGAILLLRRILRLQPPCDRRRRPLELGHSGKTEPLVPEFSCANSCSRARLCVFS
jgi:sodium transport system permease protein